MYRPMRLKLPIFIAVWGGRRNCKPYHMIDHWRYLGTYRSQLDLFDQYDTRHQPAFDVDTYKLLANALKNPPANLEITELP